MDVVTGAYQIESPNKTLDFWSLIKSGTSRKSGALGEVSFFSGVSTVGACDSLRRNPGREVLGEVGTPEEVLIRSVLVIDEDPHVKESLHGHSQWTYSPSFWYSTSPPLVSRREKDVTEGPVGHHVGTGVAVETL